METIPIWLPVVFFAIAFFYSLVGFGGGSSYLAVLALMGLPFQAIAQTALVCNLIVSGGGVWHFQRGGHFEWGRVLPFVALSIPMAYLGGRMPIGQQAFVILLGASLFAAGARVFIPDPRSDTPRTLSRARAWLIGLPTGALLGFLAGVVGIGGGIFLAPLLLLSGWTGVKQTAAAASLFVLLNSASGLIGQLTKGVYINEMIVPLGLAVLIGGQLGSRMGAYRLPAVGLRRILGALIVAVSVRLLWGAL